MGGVRVCYFVSLRASEVMRGTRRLSKRAKKWRKNKKQDVHCCLSGPLCAPSSPLCAIIASFAFWFYQNENNNHNYKIKKGWKTQPSFLCVAGCFKTFFTSRFSLPCWLHWLIKLNVARRKKLAIVGPFCADLPKLERTKWHTNMWTSLFKQHQTFCLLFLKRPTEPDLFTCTSLPLAL